MKKTKIILFQMVLYLFMPSNIIAQNESVLTKFNNTPATLLDIAQLRILHSLESMSIRVGMFIDFDIFYSPYDDKIVIYVWTGAKTFVDEPKYRSIINELKKSDWEKYSLEILDIVKNEIPNLSNNNLKIVFKAIPWMIIKVKGEYFSQKIYAVYDNGKLTLP